MPSSVTNVKIVLCFQIASPSVAQVLFALNAKMATSLKMGNVAPAMKLLRGVNRAHRRKFASNVNRTFWHWKITVAHVSLTAGIWLLKAMGRANVQMAILWRTSDVKLASTWCQDALTALPQLQFLRSKFTIFWVEVHKVKSTWIAQCATSWSISCLAIQPQQSDVWTVLRNGMGAHSVGYMAINVQLASKHIFLQIKLVLGMNQIHLALLQVQQHLAAQQQVQPYRQAYQQAV